MKIPFLQVEPTTRCNYTCGFCAGRHMPQADLDPAQFARLIDQVDGLEHIELQGEGEPLLHPGFFDMIAIARRKFPGVGVSMISNGSLFTAENIERILEYRIARIFVSMESADDERFQTIRGGRLERVRRGIRALLAARDARGLAAPTVGLAVTVLRSTVDDVFDNVVPLYRALGLDGGITLQPLQAMPQYVSCYDAAMRDELCRPADMQRFDQRFGATPALAAIIAERGRGPGFYELLYGSTAGRPACPWLENGLYLAQDGALMPCCHVKDASRYALGRLDSGLPGALAARAAMAAQLAAGQVPAACTGCDLAHRVAIAATRARG